MGLRYVLFRLGHEFLRISGLMKRKFPVQPPETVGPSLENAMKALSGWPWQGKNELDFRPLPDHSLEAEVHRIMSFRLMLFGVKLHTFQGRSDWHRHPETGFVYDKNLHWTQIPDFSAEAGDIKFVWERARFGHIQTIMRFDLLSGLDQSSWVFDEIESFIDENPLNCGPHYRCSQEISLRVINWLGAISFYRDSPALSENRWRKIWHSMYWQIHHVRQNIGFSRIAVRNNHAITETLMLYIFGTLFPKAANAREWKESGKQWFEEEIGYQIYPDGSYLQFSMNYHRVVVQLLTLAIRFAERSGERFAELVYERAAASLEFLRFFQDPVTGWLPNYGANDGALFFRFSQAHFRDFRPQLEALALSLNLPMLSESEDGYWFGKGSGFFVQKPKLTYPASWNSGLKIFPDGGFAGIRTREWILFFRCGSHADRPSQADNLHLDLWYQGKNILRDAGSYKYNAAKEDIRYFFGTESHNAIMLNGEDQMQKGPRFIWFNWTQALHLSGEEDAEKFILSGEISAFQHLAPGIRHRRTIRAFRNRPEWIIEDEIMEAGGRELMLLWHTGPDFSSDFRLEVTDSAGNILFPGQKEGWYSECYGVKESAPYLVFRSAENKFITRICKT